MVIYTILLDKKIVYVGQTIQNPFVRFSAHRNSGKKTYTVIAKAFKKYGKERFEFNIIEYASDQDTLDFLEKYYIKFYNPK